MESALLYAVRPQRDRLLADKQQILIVEDDFDLAKMLEAYFSVQGYGVLTAAWGEDAIRIGQESAPDLVVLDIRLPDIDGYEVAVRAWAGFDNMAAEVVQGTDKRRIEWVRSRFLELGFSSVEAEMRARLFVYYQLAEPSVFWREPKSKQREMIRLRHRLLTSRVPT